MPTMIQKSPLIPKIGVLTVFMLNILEKSIRGKVTKAIQDMLDIIKKDTFYEEIAKELNNEKHTSKNKKSK
mgnify:CR=1 FL=1